MTAKKGKNKNKNKKPRLLAGLAFSLLLLLYQGEHSKHAKYLALEVAWI
jgi:hypothetical protein